LFAEAGEQRLNDSRAQKDKYKVRGNATRNDLPWFLTRFLAGVLNLDDLLHRSKGSVMHGRAFTPSAELHLAATLRGWRLRRIAQDIDKLPDLVALPLHFLR
jgi:hypothetical protein